MKTFQSQTTKQLNPANTGRPTRNIVLKSWRRSMSYGINPQKQSAYPVVSDKELSRILNKNKNLIALAIPEMKKIFELLKDSDPCIVLTDPDGVLIANYNIKENAGYENNKGFSLGSKWGEAAIGTNAIGLALAEKEVCFLTSNEHFIQDGYHWTCFSSPIFDKKGEIAGALGLVYEEIRDTSADIMALVINAGRSIEQSYYKKTSHQRSQLGCQASALAELIFDGLLIIDEQKKISFMNQVACDFFSVSLSHCLGYEFKEIIHEDNFRFLETLNEPDSVFNQSKSFKIKVSPNEKPKKIIANFLALPDLYRAPYKKYMPSTTRYEGLVITFKQLEENNKVLSSFPRNKANNTFDHLIGKSSNFLKAVEEARLVAETDANVLLLGESGVGKDVFAQCIHNASSRSTGPYLGINCASIPQELLSSELFGYDDGAFTGARKGGNPGKLELANEGTLLLDEIGEMSIHLQAYFLRAIESKEIMRVGGNKMIQLDTRIMSATNRDIQEAIATGGFRADLYYRLGVISITIPSLKERREDIPLLADRYISLISQEMGKKITKISPEFMEKLTLFDFPGNIRELKNIIERSIILSKNNRLTIDLLPDYILNTKIEGKSLQSKAEIEKSVLIEYLEKFHYNKTKAAEAIGISRSNLYKKMKIYNI